MTVRFRLTLIYTTAMLVTLVLAGGVIWWQLRGALRASLDDTLQARAAAVLTTIENQGSIGIQESDPTTGAGVFVVIFNVQGRRVDATTNTPPGLPAPVAASRLPEVVLSSHQYALRVLVGDGGLQVVAGTSLTALNNTMERLASWMLLVGGLGALVSVAGGWLLAGRALRPVAMLTAEAGHIGADDLDRRLPVPDQPDELQALAITLNGMLERVASALGRQQAFVAAASHDLRTPIAALQAELDLADDDRSTNDEMRAAIRSAHAEAERLGELATALLDLAGADAQGRALVRMNVRADELLASVVRRTMLLAGQCGVTVTQVAPTRTVRVDRLRIEQAVTNVVANAIRYSSAGSVVEIVAHVESTAGLDGAAAGTELLIDVLDRGPGILPDQADTIFLPFQRGRNAVGIGAGLGLATAAAAVHAHHGTIGFASREDAGTRFWIRVPA